MWQYPRGKKQVNVSKYILFNKKYKCFFRHNNFFHANWLKNTNVDTVLCHVDTATSTFSASWLKNADEDVVLCHVDIVTSSFSYHIV
jgi:hypothetical protein